MMSMGCSMVPMMFPGVSPYMPHMGMGIGMGMGMNQAMMPFPNILASPHLPSQNAAAQLGPRFLMPGFHTQQQLNPSTVGMVPLSQPPDPILGSLMMQNSSNQPQIPNFVDLYKQYMSHQQFQSQQMQNPAAQNGINNRCTRKGAENLESQK